MKTQKITRGLDATITILIVSILVTPLTTLAGNDSLMLGGATTTSPASFSRLLYFSCQAQRVTYSSLHSNPEFTIFTPLPTLLASRGIGANNRTEPGYDTTSGSLAFSADHRLLIERSEQPYSSLGLAVHQRGVLFEIELDGICQIQTGIRNLTCPAFASLGDESDHNLFLAVRMGF